MPIVRNTILDVEGEPVRATVRIRLIASDTSPAAGFTDDGTVLGTVRKATDDDGVWSADLTSNAAISPAGTYYEVIQRAGGSEYTPVLIVVPDGAGPYQLEDLIVAEPPDPASMAVGITQLGAPGGVATLDDDGQVPLDQLGNVDIGDIAVSSVAGRTGDIVLSANDIASGTFLVTRLPTGTTSTTVALGDHLHTGVYQPAGSYATSAHTHDYAATGHDHSGVYQPAGSYAASAHDHDGRYYTDTEIDTLLVGYSATGHTHAYSPTGHNHDGVYQAAGSYAASGHDHSGTYDPAGTGASAAASAVATHSADTTAVHGIADTAALVLTDDARLTNARTPTAHAASHVDGGSDEISIDAGQVTSGTFAIGRIPTGTSGTTAALGDHAHTGTYATAGHTHTGTYDPAGTAVSAVSTHEADTTNVHGIADTSALVLTSRTITAGTGLTGGGTLAADRTLSASGLTSAHFAAASVDGVAATASLRTIGTGAQQAAAGNHNHDAAYAALSHVHAAGDVSSGTLDLARIPTGTTGTTVALGNHTHAGSGGDVVGPASSVDNTVVRFDGTTGKLIQASSFVIADNGDASIDGSLIVTDAIGASTKNYRFRTSGSNLDVDFAGAGLFLSGFTNADYTGGQFTHLRLEHNANTAHAVGEWGFAGSAFGGFTFVVNGSTGVLERLESTAAPVQGTATLVGGTVVVSTTAVTANSRIFLTGQNTSGTPGVLGVTARTAGTSFTITSSSGSDTRAVAWTMFEPV